MINLVYVVAGNMPGAPVPAGYLVGAKRFAATYVQHPPDYEHRLFLIDSNGGFTPAVAEIFDGITYDVIPYHGSGWDIGAQFYAALTMSPDDWIMCFSSWAHFRRPGWLRAFAEARESYGDGLYASMISFEIQPHVRGTGYFLRCGRFQRYPFGINSRSETFKWEWGPNSITNWFAREGYGVWAVTPDNGVLTIDKSRSIANGFRNGDQSNIWTYDKHTDVFERASVQEKQELTSRTYVEARDLSKSIHALLLPSFASEINADIRADIQRLVDLEEAHYALQDSLARSDPAQRPTALARMIKLISRK